MSNKQAVEIFAFESIVKDIESCLRAVRKRHDPIDNGNAHVFCGEVRLDTLGCVRGAGHNGPHALSMQPYPPSPVMLVDED